MFKFRLQRVLDLRARTERDAATALVGAQEAADAARAAQLRLEEARAEMAARITTGMAAGEAPDGASTGGASTGGSSVGALRNFSFLLDRMDERVAGAAQQSSAAQHAVTAHEDALRAAYRDRRTLDRLRERHHDAWRAGEAAIDRAAMDEIALTRFTQPGAAGPRTTDTSES
jgi:flagellar biosynthesis chaperone FliJ